jgi:L-2-hydroxyglutarate oxidase LhgO
MERFEADAVVIGAGAVGLATARALARSGRDVLVVERQTAFGTETSSRNSEVIHAGIYYATGSLKARLSVAGRRALYAFCGSHGVRTWKCGKLVVAVGEDEATGLDGILTRARANGVEGLNLLTGAQAHAMEPALSPHVSAAIHSLETGVFDSHGYMLALTGEIEDAGGSIAFGVDVIRAEADATGIDLHVMQEGAPLLIRARTVVNAAGLYACDLATRFSHGEGWTPPEPRYAKGVYFTISGKTPFSRLIYPLPTAASLGLHLTVDLNGRGKLGPDVEWLEEGARPPFDYRVDPARAARFYASARRYWPSLSEGALSPDYSGVRPKLVGPGEPSGDFQIVTAQTHGFSGLVHLLGIESPGLTSSLAIGDEVVARLKTSA